MALKTKEISAAMQHKVASLKKQVEDLQQKLSAARQNIKRRKRQLQDLKG